MNKDFSRYYELYINSEMVAASLDTLDLYKIIDRTLMKDRKNNHNFLIKEVKRNEKGTK